MALYPLGSTDENLDEERVDLLPLLVLPLLVVDLDVMEFLRGRRSSFCLLRLPLRDRLPLRERERLLLREADDADADADDEEGSVDFLVLT